MTIFKISVKPQTVEKF